MQSCASTSYLNTTIPDPPQQFSSSAPTQHGLLRTESFGDGSPQRPESGTLQSAKLSGTVTPDTDKANRIAQYEAMGSLPSYGGGQDAGFIVKRTNWAGRALGDTPISKYPNGRILRN
jgi:hypothetical protein